MSKRLVIMVLSMLSILGIPKLAWADLASCNLQPFDVIMATPFSSRIDWVGDPLQAVLSNALVLPNGQTLPAGTKLRGKVKDIRPSERNNAGEILVQFTRASGPGVEVPVAIDAYPATVDGWLRQSDADTPVWHVSLQRSTRLLTMKIQRRLGADRAVWAQVLGIHRNMIPNPSTDEFMQTYNRHDVLVGAGDRLQLQLGCGPLNHSSVNYCNWIATK